MDPQIVATVIRFVAEILPKLVDLFSHVGGRDAFLAALDSALIVARAKTDADLASKHGRP